MDAWRTVAGLGLALAAAGCLEVGYAVQAGEARHPDHERRRGVAAGPPGAAPGRRSGTRSSRPASACSSRRWGCPRWPSCSPRWSRARAARRAGRAAPGRARARPRAARRRRRGRGRRPRGRRRRGRRDRRARPPGARARRARSRALAGQTAGRPAPRPRALVVAAAAGTRGGLGAKLAVDDFAAGHPPAALAGGGGAAAGLLALTAEMAALRRLPVATVGSLVLAGQAVVPVLLGGAVVGERWSAPRGAGGPGAGRAPRRSSPARARPSWPARPRRRRTLRGPRSPPWAGRRTTGRAGVGARARRAGRREGRPRAGDRREPMAGEGGVVGPQVAGLSGRRRRAAEHERSMTVRPAVEWTRTSAACRTSGMRSVNPRVISRACPKRAVRRPASVSSRPQRTSAADPGTARASAVAPSRSPTAQPPPEITTTARPRAGRAPAAPPPATAARRTGGRRPRVRRGRGPGDGADLGDRLGLGDEVQVRAGWAQKRSAATSVTTATTGTGRRPIARRRPGPPSSPGTSTRRRRGLAEAMARRRPRPQASRPIAPKRSGGRDVVDEAWTRSKVASPTGAPKLDPSTRPARRARPWPPGRRRPRPRPPARVRLLREDLRGECVPRADRGAEDDAASRGRRPAVGPAAERLGAVTVSGGDGGR